MAAESKPVRLRIQVEPSPETNDHEVRLFGDEQNLVDRFGQKMIGLDPDDILLAPSPLAADATARERLIGRCDCGVIGCGDVRVWIHSRSEIVTWSAVHGPREPVYFEASAYRAEIERALADHSWETPTRTVARFIRNGVDRDRLAAQCLTYSWTSHDLTNGSLTIALELEPGPYQLLVAVPWPVGIDPRGMADSIIALLARAPSTWPDVTWLGQVQGLGPPALAGPGWHAWRH